MTLRTLRTLRLAGALSVALSAALIPSAAFAQQPAATPGRGAGRDLTLAIGEQVVIPEKLVPHFKPGKALRESVDAAVASEPPASP